MVKTLHVIYIYFYSLTSRTHNDTVKQIVTKNLLLWWSFNVLEVTFYGMIQFQDINRFKCTNKDAIKNLWKLRTAIINGPIRLQLINCHKNKLLYSIVYGIIITRVNVLQV